MADAFQNTRHEVLTAESLTAMLFDERGQYHGEPEALERSSHVGQEEATIASWTLARGKPRH